MNTTPIASSVEYVSTCANDYTERVNLPSLTITGYDHVDVVNYKLKRAADHARKHPGVPFSARLLAAYEHWRSQS